MPLAFQGWMLADLQPIGMSAWKSQDDVLVLS